MRRWMDGQDFSLLQTCSAKCFGSSFLSVHTSVVVVTGPMCWCDSTSSLTDPFYADLSKIVRP